MIRFVTGELEADFSACPVYSPALDARIRTLCQIYGLDSPHASFWLQISESEKLTAAISLCGGQMNISAGPDADIAELRQFLAFMGGYYSITLPESAREALPSNSAPREAFEMLRKNPTAASGAISDANLSDTYALLCEIDGDFSRHTQWESWYVHTSHLVRHGLGFCLGIYDGNKLISTGGVYASGAGHALIGGVATLPAYSGRGYAATIVGRLAERSAEIGLVPVLLAKTARLADWYGTMGFKSSGQKILEAVYEQYIL